MELHADATKFAQLSRNSYWLTHPYFKKDESISFKIAIVAHALDQ
jgi:hypothetical protein